MEIDSPRLFAQTNGSVGHLWEILSTNFCPKRDTPSLITYSMFWRRSCRRCEDLIPVRSALCWTAPDHAPQIRLGRRQTLHVDVRVFQFHGPPPRGGLYRAGFAGTSLRLLVHLPNSRRLLRLGRCRRCQLHVSSLLQTQNKQNKQQKKQFLSQILAK